MPKINSGLKLVKLMKEAGTGPSKLELLEKVFPKDKYGKVLSDVKAEVVVEHLKEHMEENPGEIPELTLEKLISFHTTGDWKPSTPEFDHTDGPIEFEDTPDEVEVKPELKVEPKTEVKSEPKKEDDKKDKKLK